MGVEDFRVDSVLILLAQALRRMTGAGTVVADTVDIMLVVSAAGTGDLK